MSSAGDAFVERHFYQRHISQKMKTVMVSPQRTLHKMGVVLVLCTTFVTMVTAGIFSSTMKVERLANQEEAVLRHFRHYIDAQYAKLQELNSFYTSRSLDLLSRPKEHKSTDFEHPNAVFRAIRRLSSDYSVALGDHFESFRRSIEKNGVRFEASTGDIRGARLSLLRLQNVYQLRAEDMASGDYLGHTGPSLTASDTFGVGQTAFTEGILERSIEWLNLTLTLLSDTKVKAEDLVTSDPSPPPSTDHVKALLGRVYVYHGDDKKAKAIYEEIRDAEEPTGDLINLVDELVTQPRASPEEEDVFFQDYSRLCSLENKLHVPNPYSSHLVCRYRAGALPYYRYKQEILSVAPFASVIYNITTDAEAEELKGNVRDKLVRGGVGNDDDAIVSDSRTSDVGWVNDVDSPAAARISRRIKFITGLEVQQSEGENKTMSSEPFQVVNYGLGGHYGTHMDCFGVKEVQSSMTLPPYFKRAGDRMATVLIYLSDVTKGGATVFTEAGIAVPPTKNMALFWYNYKPSYKMDEMTMHAGCPVLIGHKWIANKWIWTYRNMLKRRCGLTRAATQLDIEPDMDDNYGLGVNL